MIFLITWLTMLLIGAAHSLDGRIPSLGYWTVLTLTIAVRLALYGIATSSTEGNKTA